VTDSPTTQEPRPHGADRWLEALLFRADPPGEDPVSSSAIDARLRALGEALEADAIALQVIVVAATRP
jgi:hypothetical protein